MQTILLLQTSQQFSSLWKTLSQIQDMHIFFKLAALAVSPSQTQL